MSNDAIFREVAPQLRPNESIKSAFVANLDDQLHFADVLVVLTNQRILASIPLRAAPDFAQSSSDRQWQSWNCSEVKALRMRSHTGMGTLELIGPSGRLACWNYTAAQFTNARDLVDQFDASSTPQESQTSLDHGEDWLDPVSERPPQSRTLLRLFRFARPHLRLIFLGGVLAIASTTAGLIPPYLTMPLVDNVLIPYQNSATLPDNTRGTFVVQVAWYLAGLGGAAVAAWLLAWVQGAVTAWVSERISADLRNQTFSHLMRLSLEFFGTRRTGDLISRVSSDTDRICLFLADNLADFATDVLMVLGTAIVLLSIDPALAIATLLPFPLIVWLVYRIRGRLTAGFARGGRAWAEMNNVLTDTVPGIRVVKAFAQEATEIARFRRANDGIVSANDKVNTLWAAFWPLVVLLNQIGLLVVWAVGAWRVFDHQITVGVLTAFIQYIGRFYTRLESMSRMFSITQRAAVSTQRLFQILDRVPSVAEPAEPRTLGRISGEIELRNVSFRYNTRVVLDHFNLHVQPGEMIGLVGHSGAGKSTLLNLICRFYDVCDGAILVDGNDIRSFRVHEYRRNIGIVLQDPFLFYGSIAENIAYGCPSASRDAIVAAAQAACAHEFILRQPDGYDSIVGERGLSLSGGERQRVSIARAILIDPRILILDEATSSVDTETEQEIQAALNNLIRGRTTIAVAHRLSTLRRADRLVVLENGKIAEIGQHDELLKLSGAYARLHHAQMKLAENGCE